MLGFILSKMQMLLFATGIFIVVLMFLNFVSGMDLRNVTSSMLELNSQMISGQLSSEHVCSFQTATIPEFFNYGLTSNRLYYELNFSRVDFVDYQKLILSVNEYNKTNILDAKSVNVFGNIVLIDPSFIASSDPITSSMVGLEKISLYPRQALKGQAVAPPNAFVALKEVNGDNLSLYVIPCTTLAKSFTDSSGKVFSSNNCEENVLKVGCYLLKKEKGNPVPNDKLSTCFSITNEIIQGLEGTTQSRSFSWSDCLNHGYVS